MGKQMTERIRDPDPNGLMKILWAKEVLPKTWVRIVTVSVVIVTPLATLANNFPDLKLGSVFQSTAFKDVFEQQSLWFLVAFAVVGMVAFGLAKTWIILRIATTGQFTGNCGHRCHKVFLIGKIVETPSDQSMSFIDVICPHCGKNYATLILSEKGRNTTFFVKEGLLDPDE